MLPPETLDDTGVSRRSGDTEDPFDCRQWQPELPSNLAERHACLAGCSDGTDLPRGDLVNRDLLLALPNSLAGSTLSLGSRWRRVHRLPRQETASVDLVGQHDVELLDFSVAPVHDHPPETVNADAGLRVGQVHSLRLGQRRRFWQGRFETEEVRFRGRSKATRHWTSLPGQKSTVKHSSNPRDQRHNWVVRFR
jgi:hypothetical protein